MTAQLTAVGRIGRIDELKQTNSGVALLSFSIAVNQYRSGNEHTTWLDVVTFNGFATSLSERLAKGDQVFVSGELWVEDFTRTDNSKGRSVRVLADKVTRISKRAEASQREQAEERIAPRPRPQQAPTDGDYEDLPF